MTHKRCSKCKQDLDISEFGKDKHMRDGLSHWCKSCRRQSTLRYKRNNKEKRAAQEKRYYEKNKDKLLTYNRNYRKANKDKLVEYKNNGIWIIEKE